MILRTILVLTGAALLSGCGSQPRGLQVVAGTNVYGDIAAQIGGAHARVTSVLSDPNADPHLFEPGTKNGLAVAQAKVTIANGLGYDAFMDKLQSASPSKSRVQLNVADLLGVTGKDANPHLWYDVPRVPAIAAGIERALAQADPRHANAYRAGLRRFDASLAALDGTVAAIKRQHAGEAVAYTEPVPGYLIDAAGLRNVAPSSFTRSIEDGTEPPPAAVNEMLSLLRDHKVRVLLYNSQAVSPITARVRDAARAAGIPVLAVTETLPKGESFQQWQLRQAEALEAALQ